MNGERWVSRAAVEYLAENIESEIDDDDVFEDLDGNDLEEGKDRLRELIEGWLDDMGADYTWFEIREVIDNCAPCNTRTISTVCFFALYTTM